MTGPIIELSQDAFDYQRVCVDTVTLVNATSSQAIGQSKSEAGIGIQFAVDGKMLRVPLLSALDIAREELSESLLEVCISEIMRTTSVGSIPKKNKMRYLDPQSPHFATAVKRLVMTVKVAAANFARDIENLVKLYDQFTTVSGAELPHASAFLLQTAFNSSGLLAAYRTKHQMPENANPMLTDKAREVLTRFKVSYGNIPTYDPTRASAAPLPAGPASLRDAYQFDKYMAEVQILEKALANAAQAGLMAPIVVDRQFRELLATAIAHGRKMASVAPAVSMPAAPSPLN